MHACNHAWDVPSVFIHRALVCWLQVGHPGPTGRLITGFRCRRLFEQHFLYTTHSETHAANQRRSTRSQTKGRHQPATAPHLRGFSWCAPGNIALNSGALPTLSHRQHPAPKRQLQKRNKNKKIAALLLLLFTAWVPWFNGCEWGGGKTETVWFAILSVS